MKIKLFALLPAILMLAATVNAQKQPALKTAFQNNFLVGAALNPSQFCESNKVEAVIVKSQFNSITPENVLKWEVIHPLPGQYDFTLADKYVAFGVTNHMFVIGHTLVWHSQTPDWVFQGEGTNAVTRDLLLQRMRDHISTLMGRYKGKVKGWDVVNEALDEDGTLRDSPWHRIIGDDYLVKAFQFAHDADPQAELYYNDYALENPAKRAGAIALVKNLQAAGVKITAIGSQMHIKMDWPTPEAVSETITAFGQLGVKVNITELDLDVLPDATLDHGADVEQRVAQNPALNPYPNELPDSIQQAAAKRYANLFAVFVKHREVVWRVTLWGVTDSNSWLNDWPMKGRTNYPLLFDREGKPKLAFERILKTANPVKSPKHQALSDNTSLN